MGGGKSSAPAAPDYSSLAASSTEAAQIDAQTSANQLAWSEQQYNDIAPYTKQYLQSMTDSTNQNMQNAQDAESFYKSTYQPIETQFAQEAQGWNSPGRAEQQSAAAQGDVATSFSGQRQAALQSLESYGIDPSQTRYAALDLGTRISQAASQAAAGTQSRLNTEATGLALQGEAINIGRGYPGQVAQSYQTATGAGAAGINAANQSYSTGSGSMGTGVQWGGLQSSNLSGAVQAQNTGFQNQLASYNSSMAVAQNESGGIGSLVGGLGMAGILAMSDRRLKTDIKRIGYTDDRIPVVSYRFKDEPKGALRIGVIAQDVEKKRPDAVIQHPSGYKMVNYGAIGGRA